MIHLRDLLYSIEPTVKNTVLYIKNLAKRADVMLNVLSYRKSNTYRGWKETFGGDGYVYDTDCGDGFTGIYLSSNSSSCIH